MGSSQLTSFIHWGVHRPLYIVCEVHLYLNRLFIGVDIVPVVGVKRQLKSIANHPLPAAR